MQSTAKSHRFLLLGRRWQRLQKTGTDLEDPELSPIQDEALRGPLLSNQWIFVMIEAFQDLGRNLFMILYIYKNNNKKNKRWAKHDRKL